MFLSVLLPFLCLVFTFITASGSTSKLFLIKLLTKCSHESFAVAWSRKFIYRTSSIFYEPTWLETSRTKDIH
jgi:hypothetical protein